jgi:hypothetical protein
VKHKLPLTLGAVALVVMALSVGLLGWLRWREAETVSRPFRVRTYGGTNYTVRLSEITVGKLETGYVVVVTARLENPNDFPVTLKRDWFILVDHDKDYYQPSTNGTQTATIAMPARGVAERETFSYTVPDDTLAGLLALEIGRYYWIMIKNPKPFTRQLKSGEFVSFRRRDW